MYRDGINQNWYGKRANKIIILSQLRDRFIEVEGSKMEKIFIIMFKVIEKGGDC